MYIKYRCTQNMKINTNKRTQEFSFCNGMFTKCPVHAVYFKH